MRRWAWILALTTAVATASYAQLIRQLPSNGKLGEMVGQQHLYPLVQINDKVLRLAPGGRVYDENNRTIVHGNLPPAATVLYVREQSGDVSRIYILRPVELETLRRAEKR